MKNLKLTIACGRYDRTQALIDVLLEVGADRVLYSVDYPYEDMGEAADWFDRAAIS